MVALTSSSVERHLRISTDSAAGGEQLVHALAQLPSSVTGTLVGEGPERARLELLARAYGIEDRLLGGEPPAGADPVPSAGMTMAELVDALAPGGGTAAFPRGDDGVLTGERIVVVTNLPVHYRLPLFAGIARRLESVDARLDVVFAAGRDADRDWIVPGEALRFGHRFLEGASLEHALERLRPTVVLAAGFSPRAARAAAWATVRRARFGIWSGEIRATASGLGRARVLSRRAILSRAAFAVAYGSSAAAYLRALDRRVPLVHGRNSSPLPPPVVVTERPVEILAVARAIPGKGLEVLLDAFAQLSDLDCRLTVAGGGAGLAALVERAGATTRVRFTGALPPSEVRALHAATDVFAFPSQIDVFGLALVEAMGAGAAVATGPKPGVVADLVVSGRNGIVVGRDEPDAWAAALRLLVADAGLRGALGAAAARTVAARWTIEHAVDAMIAGFRLGVLGRRP